MIGRSVLTLRFYGEDLDIEELTALLGAEPTEITRRGDVQHSGRVMTENSWRYSVADRQPADLAGQIDELFQHLTDELQVWTRLQTRYQGDLFCGLFMGQTNEALGFGPSTLAAIASRGLRLEFDLYDWVEGD